MMFELIPMHHRQKSFGGNARVQIDENGNMYLHSYHSVVVAVTAEGWCLLHDKAACSPTTRKHVNEFLLQREIISRGLSKKELEAKIGEAFKAL